jgi:hypothetical protein
MIGERAQRARRTTWKTRHIALPAEHGAWVFLLSPLAAGLLIGGFTPASPVLVVAALAAFLVRQPVTIAVKALSGRRPKSELRPALTYAAVYGGLGLAAVTLLIRQGYAALLLLAVPALPVLAWHLWLVSRRAERRQMGVEILGGGALALAAPAAYWIGVGGYHPLGWALWALAWLQTAGSIVYAYLRLEQRKLPAVPPARQRWQMGRVAILSNLAILLLVTSLALARVIPPLVPLAFALQPLEAAWGATHPAVKVRPARIGLRQLAVSALFTVLLIVFWLA